jgi:hypothetical protein
MTDFIKRSELAGEVKKILEKARQEANESGYWYHPEGWLNSFDVLISAIEVPELNKYAGCGAETEQQECQHELIKQSVCLNCGKRVIFGADGYWHTHPQQPNECLLCGKSEKTCKFCSDALQKINYDRGAEKGKQAARKIANLTTVYPRETIAKYAGLAVEELWEDK